MNLSDEMALNSILLKLVKSGNTQVSDKKVTLEMNTRDFLKLTELMRTFK